MAFVVPPNPGSFFPFGSEYQYDFTSLTLTPISMIQVVGNGPTPVALTQLAVTLANVQMIKTLRYGNRVQGEEIIYGTSYYPMGRTRGHGVSHFSLDMELAQADYLRAQLGSVAGALGAGYMDTIWAAQIVRTIPGHAQITDTAIGLRTMKDEIDFSQGGRAAMASWDMGEGGIIFPNGQPPSIAVPNFTQWAGLLASFGIG